jgi:GT2 family glycosyltransferase
MCLEWPDLDVIVVDNASTDGSPDRIGTEFGSRVRLIRRQTNSPTAGRNEGFRAALGEIVLSLDNDIVLTDPTVVQKAVALLQYLPTVGALAFRIGSVEHPNDPLPEHWWHPVALSVGKGRFFYTHFFGEGAVVLRKSAIAAVGGYDDDFFHGFECIDFVFRLIEQGFEILYCPTLTCIEIRVRGWQHQARSRINYLTLRNKLWTAWKDMPFVPAVSFAITRIIASGVRSIRYGWVDLWLSAVVDGVAAPVVIRRKRHPLPPDIWERICRIRRGHVCPEVESFANLSASHAADVSGLASPSPLLTVVPSSFHDE